MPSSRTKARRVTQACDFCHRRGLKCRRATAAPGRDEAACLTCLEYGEQCTRTRQPKKRGTKRNSPLNEGSDRMLSKAEILGVSLSCLQASQQGSSPGSLRNRKIITALLDVYLDTIHPIFPFYCERELWVGWRDGSFPRDASDYAGLMCMCALSAQHVGDRALFNDDEPVMDTTAFATDYLNEAEALVVTDLQMTDLINVVRSYGFLALLGAQKGNTTMMQKYLGLFHGVSARFNFHDESRWPAGLSQCDIEVRRRLWWAIYRLEVHVACVLGSPIRCSETQCDIGYPSGTHHPAFIPGREGQFEDWFSGWNSTTDLYRLLEHAVLSFRLRNRKHPSVLLDGHDTKASIISDKIAKIQNDLLPQFGSASSRSTDSGRNRCGFQACNILCTLHFARMISSLTGQLSIDHVCQTAKDLMTSMNSVPEEYIRATGSPLLQQLAGVGHMLLGVARKQSVPGGYPILLEVMCPIVDFLTKFSKYNTLAATARNKLSAELQNYEQCIQNAILREPNTDKDPRISEPSLERSPCPQNFTLNNHDEQEFLTANLLRAFSWPFNPMNG